MLLLLLCCCCAVVVLGGGVEGGGVVVVVLQVVGSHRWANGLLEIPAFFHHQHLTEQRAVAL